MIYTVTLNPALDYVVSVPGLVPGAVNRASGEAVQFGGKGINVSVMLGRLGLPSVALGLVAGFTGAALEAALQQEGMHTEFIRLPQGLTRINVKIKAQQETDLNGNGPALTPAAREQLTRQLAALGPGDTLVLAGSLPAGAPENLYAELLAAPAGRGVRCVVDTTGERLCATLCHRPFLVKPNQAELSEILGQPLQTQAELVDGARWLQEQGARNVLVSLAGAGALLLDENGEAHRLAAPAGVVQNSVGAGDSMVAGFLAGYARSGRYADALRLATAAGSATAFALGLASRAEVEALLAKMK